MNFANLLFSLYIYIALPTIVTDVPRQRMKENSDSFGWKNDSFSGSNSEKSNIAKKTQYFVKTKIIEEI